MKSILAAIILSFLVPSVVQADEKTDLQKMQGEWKFKSAMRGGKGAPEAILSAKFVVEKDKFIITITVNGMERKSPIQVKLHEKKTPKQIDFIKDGKVNSHGIYELKGKKLTLCFDRARRDRPKTFESKEGTQVQLLVLERREKK